MALPKVCGIETEYGIFVRGAENDPVAASSLLVNAYADRLGPRPGWDYEHERPSSDARDPEPPAFDGGLDPELESRLVNTVLRNGARYYVDHAHPELSTPEVRTARDAVLWDVAGERIVRRSVEMALGHLPSGAEIVIHKNNSDGKGNSYGCHENYLVDREVPFGRVVNGVLAHFISRQVICGAGKVGSEFPGQSPDAVPYQISQRADFFEEQVGLETTIRRPIVNTRDEPHADPLVYRRLHVICGDANMSQVSTFLKVGSTSILLAMIEDGALKDDLLPANPVTAVRQISHDPTLRATILLDDGRRLTALDLQEALLEQARAWADRHGLESVGVEVGREVLERWAEVLSSLRADDGRAARWVDWVAKARILDAYGARHSVAEGSPRMRAIDLQYHDLRPERCLATRAGLVEIVEEAEAARAVDEPPSDTRAYFRGRCLGKFGDSVVAANWDSMVFDLGRDPLRRVQMSEPLRGTADLVANVIDESSTVSELLERLGS